MRILALRGANLASLAAAFELNFEAEPLRDAGLFAIVGETGAGKSTILDALCLALYDKFPRVAVAGESEDTPDPSGKSLNATDPRAILRRGAGRGFAEVDFEARDGQRYRARCELFRARDKAAGKLQNRGRSLFRIDESGTVIAAVESGVEPVNRQIVELADLTFDQFRRTALLAQGEFDAFLRAEAKERGELLEKITGAEIYGRLSKRAYEEEKQAQQRFRALDERRRQVGVLSEEERRARLETVAGLETRRAALAEERRQAADIMSCFDAVTLARERLSQAEAARETAARTRDAAAPLNERLASIMRVAPLRQMRTDAQLSRESWANAQRLLDENRAAIERAQSAHDAAHQAVVERGDFLTSLDAERAGLARAWAEAAALDAQLIALLRDENGARHEAETTAARCAQFADRYAETRQRHDETAAELKAAQSDLERLTPAKDLIDRWADIDDWLEKRAAIAQEKREAESALRAAQDALSQGEIAQGAFSEAAKNDGAIRDALLAQIDERMSALNALDEETALEDDTKLARAQEAAAQLSMLAQAHNGAAAQQVRARTDAQAHSDEAGALASRLAELEAQHAQRAAADQDAARLGDLAEAAVAPQTLHLRAALIDGVECPVCGGRDHPFAHEQHAASELVAALRASREESRGRLAEAQEALVAAQGHAARVQALIEDAVRRESEAQQIITQRTRDYAALRAGCESAPDEIVHAAPALAQMLGAIETARAALTRKFIAARKLRGDLDALRKQEADKRTAIDARRAERDALTMRLQRAAETRAALEAELKGLAERVASLDRSLAQFLPICDLTQADLDRDTAGAKARMMSVGAQYDAARKQVALLDQNLRALVPEVASIVAKLEEATAAAKTAREALAARSGLVAAAREQRGAMLDGEGTDAHRARFEVVHEAASRARDEARAALSDAMAEKAGVEAGLMHAMTALDLATRRAEATQASWRAALQRAGFDEEQAAPLLDVTAAEQETLREQVEAVSAALTTAQTNVAQRANDLAEAEAASPQEGTREETAARDAALAQQLDALSGEIGAIGEQIAQDDRARETAAAMTQELESAQADWKIWAEIDAAIGSASGDKFRRFAQAVTLGELVALANQRLALFSPRYKLECSGEVGALGLQIIDRDLGDERRSTRSLSGGERFLTSLALALALAGLEGRDSFVDTLFIDEGFGALDSATLDVAIDALETLQAQGRRVGVISHVESMQQRIATKVCVERRGGGVSVVRLRAAGWE